MNFFQASLKTAAFSTLICFATSNAQPNDPNKWYAWTDQGSTSRYYSAHVNFSATVNPYQLWTSPSGSVLKSTVFQFFPPMGKCYAVETRGAGTLLDTKIWTYPGMFPGIVSIADDADGAVLAKIVFWNSGGQFMITPFSSSGNDGQFQIYSYENASKNTEQLCSQWMPNWSFMSGNVLKRWR